MTSAPRLPSVLEPNDEPLDDDSAWVEVERTADVVGADGAAPDVVDVEITASLLRGCSLSGARIERLRMTDVVLDGCDLSGADLYEADLTRVAFESCRLSGATLAKARLTDVTFTGCKAEGLNLRMVTGARVTFDDTVLRDADLLSAAITDGRFLGCDLHDADVTKAKLGGVRLHRSQLDGLKGAEHLRGAVIDATQLVPLAVRVFAALGITVEDEPADDEDERAAGHDLR